MSEVFINGKRIRLTPSMVIGKGGEADVYRIDSLAFKIFKAPDHPDLQGFPLDQKAAAERIEEHQDKLRNFPRGLPASVVAPVDLATDRTGKRILGYTMRFLSGMEVLLRYSERSFRGNEVKDDQAAKLFLGMYSSIVELHAAGVVIGDFNDLNVLFDPSTLECYFIDADSYQFGRFLCRVYTEKFVDPLLCDLNASRPVLAKPHNPLSDWYAFNVMLMKSLTFCDPYGGVYKPPKGKPNVPHNARVLGRITVFDKHVKYPRPAVPLDRLPYELLHHFHLVFEKDDRGMFPRVHLDNFRWTKCSGCGIEHGRPTCPECQKAAPAAVRQVIQMRGKVKATRIFRTSGEIVFAAYQDQLRYVYAESSEGYPRYRRENGVVIHKRSSLEEVPIRWRIQNRNTLKGFKGRFYLFNDDGCYSDQQPVDCYGTLPIFDANARHRYWVLNGILQRDGDYSSHRIGDVLAGQTLFWVGPEFGFGFYRAADLSVSFVFDATRKGLNDSVNIPGIRGHLVDSTCFFSTERCWFMVSLKDKGRIVNRCAVIRADGSVEATSEGEQGDGSWLGEIRGKCASGKYLFSATDEGVVRIEVSGGSLFKNAEFPDTEPFVDSGCHLFAGREGLYVVDRQEISILEIK